MDRRAYGVLVARGCWKSPISSDWALRIVSFDQPHSPVGLSAESRECFAGGNTRVDGHQNRPRFTGFGVAKLI